MPTVTQHVDQSARNRAVAELIQADGKYKEWVAVALFYQAMHYVNVFLLQKLSKAPKDHRERQLFVDRWLKAVAVEYDELYQASRNARYDCHRYADADLNDLTDAADAIRDHVGKETSLPL